MVGISDWLFGTTVVHDWSRETRLTRAHLIHAGDESSKMPLAVCTPRFCELERCYKCGTFTDVSY